LRWTRCFAAILLLAVSAPAVWAAESPCFELYQNANAAGPEGSILLNRCTGETWLLVGVNTGGGSSPGWHRIPIDMTPDAQTVPMPEDGSQSEADAAYAD